MVADKKRTTKKAKADKRTETERLMDGLLAECKTPEEIVGDEGLLKRLTKQLLERALKGELTAHLGYDRHAVEGHHSGNSRNGTSPKTVKGTFGEMEIKVPRDRNSTFEPVLLPKGETRFTGFDDKILAMYARGMTTRDITAFLKEAYGVEVSAGLISTVTESVMEEVKQWQDRQLEAVYPIVYLDALRVKIRGESGQVENRAVHVAIAVNMEGEKEVLGLWVGVNEGAKYWLGILTELANRGVKDILVACVDGLKGFPEAIEAVFPQAQVQLCIVHLVRESLKYVTWKDRKQVAADLRVIYTAATDGQASERLEEFARKWDERYPMVSQVWRRNWTHVTPFFGYPPDIRRVIYTTNAVESLNMSLRKIIKTRGGFPNEEAALKLLFLALRNAAKKWTMPVQNWKQALNVFTLQWPGRVPQ